MREELGYFVLRVHKILGAPKGLMNFLSKFWETPIYLNTKYPEMLTSHESALVCTPRCQLHRSVFKCAPRCQLLKSTLLCACQDDNFSRVSLHCQLLKSTFTFASRCQLYKSMLACALKCQLFSSVTACATRCQLLKSAFACIVSTKDMMHICSLMYASP